MKSENSQSKYKLMTETPVFGLVMRLSLPTTVSMLITSIYNIADTYFVSGLGNSATGAVGVVFSIQSIIQAVGYGFGMGSQSLISRKLGEKKNDEASMYGASAFIASFLAGLLLMVLGLINVPFVMTLFGSTETALPLACSYGRWILIGAPVFCSSFVLNNILRAEGKATLSMIGLCSGGIINIGLDALFILGLGMNVDGAALATVISQLFAFIILLAFFLAKKSVISINPKFSSRSIKPYLTVFRVGLPTVFRQSLGSIATALLNNMVKPFGDAAMSAVSIANKLYMLIRSMLIGVGQGFQPVAGYNYGAKKFKRVISSFNVAVLIGTVYGIVAASLIFIFSGEIMSVFRPGDTEVIEIGGKMIRILALSIPVLGYSTFVNQFYQSLGFVLPATFLASCRQGIFFIPTVVILTRLLGLDGILISQCAADLLTFVVSIPFHLIMFNKIRKLIRMNESNA